MSRLTLPVRDPARPSVCLRMRMSQADAHYGGNLVDGARLLALFGDVATLLCVMSDGDEGLFAGYDAVEFLRPVMAGDFVEAEGWIVGTGNTSRSMAFEARKIVETRPEVGPSAADALDSPLPVCRASGTCVVKRTRRRK